MKRLLFAILLFASAAAHGQHLPACLPSAHGVFHVDLGVVPPTVSTRADSWITWVCSLPTGYRTEAWVFSSTAEATEAFQYIAGTLSLSQAQTLCSTSCWTLTSTEQTFVNGLLSQYAVKATVGASGTATTRQVYNASMQPVSGATVAVGALCNAALHIPSHLLPLGAADPYPLYDVGGQPNAATGAVLPAGSYASCNVKLPAIGIGNL